MHVPPTQFHDPRGHIHDQWHILAIELTSSHFGEEEEGEGDVSLGTKVPACWEPPDEEGTFLLGIGGGGDAVEVPPFPEPSEEDGVEAADDDEAILKEIKKGCFIFLKLHSL